MSFLTKLALKCSNYIRSAMQEQIISTLSMEREMLKKELPPYRLEKYGFKIYSQGEEDGILAEIFHRIGSTSQSFVEFGTGGGDECNSLVLLISGWKGLWIEADPQSCTLIRQRQHIFLENNKLFLKQAFVTKENINTLISEKFNGEIDLLSVDIDGNDYYVLDAISCITPRVIVCEYNAKFIPPLCWTIPYDPEFCWQGEDNQGMSLALADKLLKSKGYSLVSTNLEGTNAFFVRNDLMQKDGKELFPYEHTPEKLYNPARYRLGHIPSGHPVSSEIYPCLQ